jgi:hypothetical protein
MKKKAMIFLTILAILFSVAYFEKAHTNSEEILLSAFQNSQFETVQANLNTWTKMNDSFVDFEQMQKIVKETAHFLEIKGKWKIEQKEIENERQCILTKPSKDAKTTIKIESIHDPNKNQSTTYLIIDIILYNKYNSIPYLKKKTDEFFISKNLQSTTNITMAGSYDGLLEKKEQKRIAGIIMKQLRAKAYDTYETNQIYSVYGYTKLIDQWLMSKGNKINVNLAFRYNEYENKTYLYLASPLITVDY